MNKSTTNSEFRIAKRALVISVTAPLALTLFLFGASSAVAQQDDSQIEDDGLIEEIIVTAQKREESVQDIGLSISAFNAEQLAAAGIIDVKRLNFLVAGLNYSDVGVDAKFALRGANSTQTFSDNASIIGVFVDGVYKPHASQQTRAFFDVERLEFLKGPQGTLYGRNTFAGALNLYTNKPNMERVAGSVELTYSRFNTLRTDGFINVPVNDTFALRLAGYSENGDGYVKNNAGPNAGAPDSLGVRFSALWEPNDAVDVLFRYSYIEEQGTTAGLFGYTNKCRTVDAQGITDAFGAIEDCQNPFRGSFAEPTGGSGGIGEYNISQDFLPDADLFEENATLEINWDAGPVLLKSITSYTDFENNIPTDFDYSPSVYNIGGFDDHVESFTQEIVFSSNYDSAFQWTAGAYYSEDESFFSFWIYNQTVADNSGRPIVDTEFGPFVIFNGTPLVSTETSLGGAFADSFWVESTAMAVFAQGEFSVSDNLRLIGGLRYNDDEKDMSGGGSNFTANGPVTQLFINGSDPAIVPQTRLEAFAFNRNAPGANTSSFDYDNISWKAGIEYDLSDDMMLYATASTGFLSGSLNNNGSGTDEQESEMYEIGFKSILMDGTLLLNVAAHWTEYTNLLSQFQTVFIDPATGVSTVLTDSINGGDIEAKGLEVEVQYVPTHEWTLGLAAAFLDAEFGEFGQTSPYQFNRGVPTEFESVSGETPGWSPDLTLNFFANYTFSLENGSTLTPGILFSYSDSYNTSNLYILDPNHDQDSYTKTDLRLTWLSASGNYVVAAFIENIEDEAVLSRGNSGSQDPVTVGYLYPRNYGVMFQVRW